MELNVVPPLKQAKISPQTHQLSLLQIVHMDVNQIFFVVLLSVSLKRELQNVMAAVNLYFFSASRFSTLFTIAFTVVWEGVLFRI